MAQREVSEERSGQQLERAENDPARPRAEQRNPPGRLRGSPVARKKAQEVDLLADLRHQREYHRGGGSEQQQVEMTSGVAVLAGKFSPLRERIRIGIGNRRKGENVKDDPQRLRPQLEATDQRDA